MALTLSGIAVGVAQERAKQPGLRATSGPVVTVTSLTGQGLALISPASSNFDDAIRRLLPDRIAGPALATKPYLVILSNQSGHTIVAFSTVWDITYTDRSRQRTLAPILFVDAVSGADDAPTLDPAGGVPPVASGEERVVAMETEFRPSTDKLSEEEDINLVSWLRATTQDYKAKAVAQMQIRLDAAIFSDGLLVGPNVSNLDVGFTAKLEAKQKLFQQIVGDLDAGHTLEEAFEPAKTQAIAVPSRERSVLYGVLAAQEVVALRRRVGDAAVPALFRQAIRKRPFVVKRSQTQ